MDHEPLDLHQWFGMERSANSRELWRVGLEDRKAATITSRGHNAQKWFRWPMAE